MFENTERVRKKMISYVDRSLIMLPCFSSFFSESKKKKEKKKSGITMKNPPE